MHPLPAIAPLAQAGVTATRSEGDRLLIEERPATGLVRVHSLVDLPREHPELADWPGRTGRCRDGDPAVLQLGPREWLLLAEDRAADAALEALGAVVDRSSTAVHDVSDGLAVFRLQGAAAPWLLAKVCSLDVHAELGGSSWCARTRVGQIAVVVHYRGSASGGFDAVVDRSLARYLWELLIDSAPHAAELAGTGWAVA
ncbi:MAG: sarcosine oxidase subunit gamma family protein [Xanthomonadales bacterium]|nr:sarcosine oxidase subunit gamma family protein [Xanthomonadales bacterium]